VQNLDPPCVDDKHEKHRTQQPK